MTITFYACSFVVGIASAWAWDKREERLRATVRRRMGLRAT